MADEVEWARAFVAIARELSECSGQQDVLEEIARHATRVTGCPWAAITRAARDRPVVAATNDPKMSGRIGRIQARGGGGPTWEALGQGHTVRAPDLTTETRWPAHVQSLLHTTPVRSIVAFCLRLNDRPLGALTLYGDRPNAFADVYAAAEVYADHAALALDRLGADESVDNLSAALENSREIGMGLGILMERYKITPVEAFDLLRVASQHGHLKVRDLAAELVLTGNLGPRPACKRRA